MTTFAYSAPLRRELHVSAPLRSGEAALRPLLPGEIEPQMEVFDGLSPASRTDRFLVPVGSLSSHAWQALAALDGCNHAAWLATVDGRSAGVARIVRVGPRTAEIAFEVADDYQGLGLGTALVDTITTVAAALRFRRLQASVLGTNTRSRRLLSRIGVALEPSNGLLEGDSSFHLLDPARVDRPAVLRLAASV